LNSKRRIVTPPILLAILALAIHTILVPPMALGSGWAVLCSPDGANKLVPVGDQPAPGGLGDCDECPVCPTAHGAIRPDPSVAAAFEPPHGERSPVYGRQIDTDLPATVSPIPVGRRAPPIA
jgi:hypothetical protein